MIEALIDSGDLALLKASLSVVNRFPLKRRDGWRCRDQTRVCRLAYLPVGVDIEARESRSVLPRISGARNDEVIEIVRLQSVLRLRGNESPAHTEIPHSLRKAQRRERGRWIRDGERIPSALWSPFARGLERATRRRRSATAPAVKEVTIDSGILLTKRRGTRAFSETSRRIEKSRSPEPPCRRGRYPAGEKAGISIHDGAVYARMALVAARAQDQQLAAKNPNGE